QSAELRSDRQIPYLAEVGAGASGGINMELSYGTYDSWLESLLSNVWVPLTGGARQQLGSTVITNPAGTIAATGIHLGVVVGQYIRLDTCEDPANDGFYLVTTVGTDTITVTPSPPTTNIADTTVFVSADHLENGVTEKSFSIEREFAFGVSPAVTKRFTMFNGMEVQALSLNLTEGAIIGGGFTFLGKEGTVATATGAGTPVAATTTDPINATSNVGTISDTYGLATRATLSTALQSLTFNIDGSLRQRRAIANRTACGIGAGRFQVTGSVNAYFEDGALFEKYILHTATSLSANIHDGATGASAAATLANRIAGNTYIITFNRVQFAQSPGPSAGATDADVFTNLNFQGIYDSETGCTVQIDRFPAIA
ncbi:MAG TPA: phage tail tube protein, partial [Polyangiales bacterium]|nr:phage tail tube protein [Polyangiales bacterium]